MINQNTLTDISSYISKSLRKKFGKGPQSCHTTLYKRHLVTYIRGFLSPMEEVLLELGQFKSVEYTRASIIEHMIEEIKGVVHVSIGVETEDYYHDWNFPNNSGCIIFVLEKEVEGDDCPEFDIDAAFLKSEVSRISQIVEKIPDEIKFYPISSTIYLVERSGILIKIEKALVSKGFQKELRITKDELEKDYFHQSGRFEKIFKKPVRDIFIDWNFRNDKSMMAFILEN